MLLLRTSTTPKDVIQNDNTAQKTQRLLLKAASLLAAIMNKYDGSKVLEAKVIQGIRNTLLLLGNVSQQHSLQSRKAILQHINLQLKSLVQDADFAEAPPYLFGTNFGELAKERLEAAALILGPSGWQLEVQQRAQQRKKSHWGLKNQHLQHQQQELTRNSKSCMNAQFKCTKVNAMYSSIITPSGPCSTPPGVDKQAKTNRLSVSYKESTASPAKLEYTDIGQLGPANSTRVYDRFYPDTTPVLSPLPVMLSQEKHALVTQEVQELIRKEAIIESNVSLNSFISQRYFWLKKRRGSNVQ